jgi:hypothetical protein
MTTRTEQDNDITLYSIGELWIMYTKHINERISKLNKSHHIFTFNEVKTELMKRGERIPIS